MAAGDKSRVRKTYPQFICSQLSRSKGGMEPHRLATWRGFIGCATLWLILAVTSALEVYEEVPHVNSDIKKVNQGENRLDTGPDLENQNMQSEPTSEDQHLYEILKALRQMMVYRQTWSSLDVTPKLVKKDYGGHELGNVGLFKRFVDVLKGNRMQYRPSQSSLSQKKWKIKTGKLGSVMVCYLKLCSFRPLA